MQESITNFWGREDREVTIVVAIRKRADNQTWEIIIDKTFENGSSATSRSALPPEAVKWIGNTPGSSFDGVAKAHVISSTSSSLGLLRIRNMEKNSPTTSSIPEGPATGLMLWIEEKE